uniref:Phosphoglycerol geranylgeranyltransferase n=1 Tax=candidate division WOR-3 bacterium TaxID=2052148 RepID=A0A7C4XEP3_UNCW3
MPETNVYNELIKSIPGVFALFDPDRTPIEKAGELADFVSRAGVSGILIGSSLLVSPKFSEFVMRIKEKAKKPIILFPGGVHQISPDADAIFFLSLLSGRNPEFLIGEQVKAVFLLRSSQIEVIPVGYLLIESNNYTAVEYISNTRPIPRSKPEIAVAHALTGEYLGMKFIYLEAGSGAGLPVPVEIVREVKKNISIPLIVGGGIKTPSDARKIIDAGADFIVLGSIIEESPPKFKRIIRSLKE